MQDAIYRYIFLKIQSNEWNIKERIPSERQLALKFSVTRTTIRKILANLCSLNLLDTFSHSGYFISNSYKTGFFKKVVNFNFDHSKFEVLISSPFDHKDISNFEKISNNFDFYGHNFSKVIRVTYFDKNNKPIYLLDTMINQDLIKIFPQEHLEFTDFKLFAYNGQAVVFEKQFATYSKFKNVADTYKLDNYDYLSTYASYFSLEEKLLSLARVIYLDENSMIETNNEIFINHENNFLK